MSRNSSPSTPEPISGAVADKLDDMRQAVRRRAASQQQLTVSGSGTALSAALEAASRTTALALTPASNPHRAAIMSWRPDPYETQIPVPEKVASQMADLGHEAQRTDFDTALSAVERITRCYPSLANKSESDLQGYLAELASILVEHHPDVTQAVSAGANRDSIQRSLKFAPSPVELAQFCDRAAHKLFGHLQPARLALAFYAAARLPRVRDSQGWDLAVRTRNGDRALAIVGAAFRDQQQPLEGLADE